MPLFMISYLLVVVTSPEQILLRSIELVMYTVKYVQVQIILGYKFLCNTSLSFYHIN